MRLSRCFSGINQTRQFQSEIAGLMKWIRDVENFIQEQVIDGDPESLELQLDQCEVCCEKFDVNSLYVGQSFFPLSFH